LRLSRRVTEDQRHLEADAQTQRLLQEALRQKDLQILSVTAPEEVPAAGDHAGVAKKKELIIERLDRELAENRAAIASLQTQLSAANDQNARASTAAADRLQKQQADAQAQLDDLKKKLDEATSESEIARQRAATLEADNAKLKTDAAAIAARASDVSHIIAGLQDLERRREVYLTSILRRYRDITGEFRAMSGMLDTSHDPSSNACGGAVLSRIQNAVNSAEDDLRQMNELNARSQKLEKQLDQK
jgi:chromosome segregation ATPase